MNLLAVDIGNTSTLFVHYSEGKLGKRFRERTRDLTKSSYASLRRKLKNHNLDAAAIASVVPPAGENLKKALQKLGVKTYLIGKDIKPLILNKYKNPNQVGMDRLMNAIAAFERCQKEVIVVDFGTAITFDVISKKGEYLGGVISPGIEISLEALYQKTALLPKIRLAHPKNMIGKDTAESIRVGCSVGIGGLCDRIIDKIKKNLKFSPRVIGTGGYAVFMRKYCSSIDEIDENLTIRGIVMSYKKFLTTQL